tara:strand:+ start:108 stop:236 length:129 start_codon:yes stop_codon:yes gene_type:complete
MKTHKNIKTKENKEDLFFISLNQAMLFNELLIIIFFGFYLSN